MFFMTYYGDRWRLTQEMMTTWRLCYWQFANKLFIPFRDDTWHAIYRIVLGLFVYFEMILKFDMMVMNYTIIYIQLLFLFSQFFWSEEYSDFPASVPRVGWECFLEVQKRLGWRTFNIVNKQVQKFPNVKNISCIGCRISRSF